MPDHRRVGGLLAVTDFTDNGFGIDPDGCGCTDCITGQAFHISYDEHRIREAIRQGRPLHNRTGYEVILPNGYRLNDMQTWKPDGEHHCPGCTCAPF